MKKIRANLDQMVNSVQCNAEVHRDKNTHKHLRIQVLVIIPLLLFSALSPFLFHEAKGVLAELNLSRIQQSFVAILVLMAFVLISTAMELYNGDYPSRLMRKVRGIAVHTTVFFGDTPFARLIQTSLFLLLAAAFYAAAAGFIYLI